MPNFTQAVAPGGAIYHIPVPPPLPPPLVPKRGKIRKVKKRSRSKKEKSRDPDEDGADDTTKREKVQEKGCTQKEDTEQQRSEKETKIKIVDTKQHSHSVDFASPRTSGEGAPSPRPVIPTLALGAATTKAKDDGIAQSRFSRRQGYIHTNAVTTVLDTNLIIGM